MKISCIVLLAFLISGCSTKTINLSMEEASKLPSVGVLKLTAPDQEKYQIELQEQSFLFISYGKPNIIDTKLYVAIDLKKNIKSNEVLSVSIPDYEGLTITAISINFMYKDGYGTRGTYDVVLNPVYKYDNIDLDKIKKGKSYQNNEEINYERSFNIKVIPDLRLKELYGYSDRNFTYGSGLSSV